MHYIGKIDRNKIGEYGKKITTDDVIITDERIEHIAEHHPDLELNDLKYIKMVLDEPEYIFKDRKNQSTILMVKNIYENKKIYRMVIKLNTVSGKNNINNSIISFWSISNKKLNQYLRNEEILYSNK